MIKPVQLRNAKSHCHASMMRRSMNHVLLSWFPLNPISKSSMDHPLQHEAESADGGTALRHGEIIQF